MKVELIDYMGNDLSVIRAATAITLSVYNPNTKEHI